MDLTEEVDQVASRAEDQVEHIESEEATKHALIIPFIKALGYDPYDLQEVIPEFTADSPPTSPSRKARRSITPSCRTESRRC